MREWRFRYRPETTRAGERIYRPVARVWLRDLTGEWRLFFPYVDSGADLSLFTRRDCALLGYDIRAGKPRRIGGVGGGALTLYVHRLPVRIGAAEFRADVGFSTRDDVPQLLGRRDVFRQFRITFDERRRTTLFER